MAVIGSLLVLGLLFILSGQPGSEAQRKQWHAVSHDQTNFPLIGKHRTVPCSQCHLKGVMQGTPTDCEACHWYRKQDDRYQLQLGIHCGDCHAPHDWKIIRPNAWDHEQATGFPLGGVHKTVDCFQCHRGRVFSGQQSDCIDCHREEYERAAEPEHAENQFPTDCRICHNMSSWEGASYSHLSFPLNGMHKTARCSDCHQNGQFIGTPGECVACHLQEYNQTQNPNHRQANYPTDCEVCHGNSAVDWEGARIDHDNFWPLKGAHKGLDCSRCHYRGYDISSRCVFCHLDDYNNTRNPNHREAGFHTDCEICHPPESFTWSQALFEHGFPILSGRHGNISCSECHRTANYFTFSCIDCHAHVKTEMDEEHQGVIGYAYSNQACYACHPTGRE